MKASEIIQKALDNHYCNMYDLNRPKNGYDESKREFMCHAIEDFLLTIKPCDRTMTLYDVNASFMKLFRDPHGYSTLASFLNGRNKRYASYKARYGHGSKACYNLRVEWWKAHIAELQAKGL